MNYSIEDDFTKASSVPQNAFRKIKSSVNLICLNGEKIGDNELRRIVDSIKGNSAAATLHLRENELTDDGMIYLSELLAENTAIITLDLSDNQIGNRGLTILSQALALNSTLKQLSCGRNKIGNEGVIALCAALTSHNCGLVKVDLRGNQIGDEGLRVLVEAVKSNATISSLILSFNPITSIGLLKELRGLLSQKRMDSRKRYYRSVLPSTVHNLSAWEDSLFPPESLPQITGAGEGIESKKLLEYSELRQIDLEQIKKLQTEIEIKNEHVQNLEKKEVQYQTTLEEKEKFISRLEKDIVTLKAMMTDAEKSFEKKVEEQKSIYDKWIVDKKEDYKNISEAYLAEIKSLQVEKTAFARQHTTELENLQKSNAAVVQTLKSQQDRELSALQAKLAAMEQEKEDVIKSQLATVTTLTSELTSVRHTCETELMALRDQHLLELERVNAMASQREKEFDLMKLQHTFALDESARFIEKMEEVQQTKAFAEDKLQKQKVDHLLESMKEKDFLAQEKVTEVKKVKAELERRELEFQAKLTAALEQHARKQKDLESFYDTALKKMLEAEQRKYDQLCEVMRGMEQEFLTRVQAEQQTFVNTRLSEFYDSVIDRVTRDKVEVFATNARCIQQLTDAVNQQQQQRQVQPQPQPEPLEAVRNSNRSAPRVFPPIKCCTIT